MKNNMPITHAWFSTPVDYFKVDEKLRDDLVEALNGTEGVCDIEDFGILRVLCKLESTTDAEAIDEIAIIRARVEAVFRSFGVWPENGSQTLSPGI